VRGEYYVEHRVRRGSDGAYRWHQTRARPLGPGDGGASEWVGASTDVHALRELQESQAVMVAELQHRTRKLIAVVRSIASQTMRASPTMETFTAQFNDRLAALSRVQGLLSRADHEPITIGSLIRLELDALGAETARDRIRVEGPETALRNPVEQTLALAIHELATNARKYGALANAHGRLDVTWRVRRADDAGRWLALEWVERGVDRAREEGSPAGPAMGAN